MSFMDPAWDDFECGAWESFHHRVFKKAAALGTGHSVAPYSEIMKLVEDEWERWINGREERRAIFGAAKEGLALEIFNELDLQSADVMSAEPAEPWVTPEDRSGRYYWPLAYRVMEESMGKGPAESVDKHSETVLQHLGNPRTQGPWLKRGLVIGSIQAGKTANYSALIAKAADAGYRLIIVLSGIHNDLRRQTQERLDRDFTGLSRWTETEFSAGRRHRVRRKMSRHVGVGLLEGYRESMQPQAATNLDEDFRGGSITMEERPWLIVMKKVKQPLVKLAAWLKNQNLLAKPVLIIDDEADQASMNTLARVIESDDGFEDDSAEAEGQEATQINSLIRQVIKLAPRCSYVGYTASPFANLFVDAEVDSEELGEDLFPKDFIIQIPTPNNYFGPSEYFDPASEEEAVLYMPFPRQEARSWIDKNQVGDFPASARRCLLQFIVSAALKAWRTDRRTRGLNDQAPVESSMLVHVSHLVDVHKRLAEQISEEFLAIRRSLVCDGPNSCFDSVLRSIFEDQQRATDTVRKAREEFDAVKDWSLPERFEELFPWIQKTAEALSVQIVNGEVKPERQGLLRAEPMADVRLKPIVWVGGNKLSRGLTIPSLCMSLFLRSTGAADTLLQMGRWFGYRDGYADLCRISTTQELAENFMKICCTLNDLSEQVSSMNNQSRTPSDYRIIVQQHPGFALSSASKMRTAADAAGCYAGFNTDIRSFLLSESAPQNNFAAAARLLQVADAAGVKAYDSQNTDGSRESRPVWYGDMKTPSGALWRQVPADAVLDFLASYTTPIGAGPDDPEIGRIIRYVHRENEKGRLLNWNLWVPRGRRTDGFLPLRADFLPIDRTGSASDGENLDGDRFRLGILQSGYDQYFGVRKPLMDAAQAALEATEGPKKRSMLFRLVRLLAAQREAAGEFVDEGYMRLYAIKSGKIAESESRHWLEAPGGGLCPLIGYGLWLPGSIAARGKTNATVRIEDEDFY